MILRKAGELLDDIQKFIAHQEETPRPVKRPAAFVSYLSKFSY